MQRRNETSRCLRAAALLIASCSAGAAPAGREPVLKQIDLPHSYYYREMYLPRVTSGPGSPSWSPDSRALVYSMQGSLWRQQLDSTIAEQLTAGPGYDFQPDWSPDGKSIVFTKYFDDALELHLLNIETGDITQLTRGGAVNVEPRWSPDGARLAWVSTAGTGHFHIFIGVLDGDELAARPLRPERRSAAPRYYYSPFDHELSPTWSPDGKDILFIANPDTIYGTGGIWRTPVAADRAALPVRLEETTWKARPDWSPDGKRILYSSYLGRQWHQLWATTASGGDPLALSYGEYDLTAPRWSPDAALIAYISNEAGNTALWIQETTGGRRHELKISERRYLRPMGELLVDVRDENGAPVAARIAVTGMDGRSYAPDAAWVHADDGFDRKRTPFEIHYFHSDGAARLMVPAGRAQITAWHGLEHQITQRSVQVEAGQLAVATVQLEALDLPPDWRRWASADVHVHMNYGGTYRNTPARLVRQAAAEDLDMVYNLVVNKEQRIPDIHYFSARPDPESTRDVLLLHGQEYHTSLWGHVGLLGLEEHFLLPDFSAYDNTAAASPYPSNAVVADLARRQHGLVGYVHPFDVLPDPGAAAPLTNSLPVDVALGKVDYYEVVGFSDHRASAEVWQRLLNCGFRPAAAAGTDAMANFASLRGPVGLNRVYARLEAGGSDPDSRRDAWLKALADGRTVATNGPLLEFSIEDRLPGQELPLPAGRQHVRYRGTLRSIVPVDHLEIVMNGRVVKRLDTGKRHAHADFNGTLEIDGSGWLLLRAWSDAAHPDVFDLYPYATTSPVYIVSDHQPMHGHCDGEYFLRWLDRIAEAAAANANYNSEQEQRRILEDIERARAVFQEIMGTE